TDLPTCQTSGHNILIATEGFDALGIVKPDYVIPNGFVQIPSGVVTFAGISVVLYNALPNDGVHAIDDDGVVIQNVATNLAGASASVSPGGPTNANYGGLWWAAPGGVENGWGINFAHQGSIIFGTWFTYDITGKAWWLTLITEPNPSPGVYPAGLYVTNGPPFNATPFVKTSGATKV